MTRKVTVFGGPGTGKTTDLLDRVEFYLKDNVPPESIAFVAFSRKAADEAMKRARERFRLPERRLPWFRTLHSVCYHQIGATRAEIMQPADWKELGRLLGVSLYGNQDPTEGPMVSGPKGPRLLACVQLARATLEPLADVWRTPAGEGLNWEELEQLRKTLEQYKMDTGKMDFTDLLERYAAGEGAPLPVEAGIVDESQDLTPLQWDVASRALGRCLEVTYAGDDDQAIYRWAGARVTRFLEEAKNTEIQVLGHSHRLPRRVFQQVEAITNQIRGPRQGKEWTPDDREGDVRWLMDPLDLDLQQGEWLLLARNSCHLEPYVQACRHQGALYFYRGQRSVTQEHMKVIVTWERLRDGQPVTGKDVDLVASYYPGLRPGHDPDREYALDDLDVPSTALWHEVLTRIGEEEREYYLAVLQSGRRLQDTPSIRIDTIHGAKGGEADHVALRTDMTGRTYRGFQADPDDEHRVMYVGASRARETLTLIAPQTPRHYPVATD